MPQISSIYQQSKNGTKQRCGGALDNAEKTVSALYLLDDGKNG